jgi:plasmid stabilization system protein ParE
MTWRLIVRPLARLQIAEAADWYDAQSRHLGDEFLQAVERRLEAIANNPHQYQLLRGDLRRAIVRPFPYLIVYAVSEPEVTVFRCVHARRDQRRWPG